MQLMDITKPLLGACGLALAGAALAGCGTTADPVATPSIAASSIPHPKPAAVVVPPEITSLPTPKAPAARHTDRSAQQFAQYFVRVYYTGFARRDLAPVRPLLAAPARSGGLRDADAAVRNLVGVHRFQAPGELRFDGVRVTAHQGAREMVAMTLHTKPGGVYDERGTRLAVLQPQKQQVLVLLRWSRAAWQVVDFAIGVNAG